MPQNLTDVSSFDTVTGPSALDIRNAASVRTALQTLANRTKYLFDRHDALADIAALKAISGPADGLVRLVKNYGVYHFQSASVLSEASPWVIQPNAGGGRWIHVMYASAPRLMSQTFTANGTWTSPPYGSLGLAIGWGGGGGGASGYYRGGNNTDSWSPGGGGGGGALEGVMLFSFAPSTGYSVTIGPGGTGGLAGGNSGGDGGDSSIGGGTGVVFSGAQGGRMATGAHGTNSANYHYLLGGHAVAGTPTAAWVANTDLRGGPTGAPAQGGYGRTSNVSVNLVGNGGRNPITNNDGGVSGVAGTDGSTYRGGGPGGGGGAGPGSSGALGGNGGNGNNAGVGSAGSAGGSAAANSGAGGGGGGAGGAGSSGEGSSGAGGNGGSGKVTIIWIGA